MDRNKEVEKEETRKEPEKLNNYYATLGAKHNLISPKLATE